MLALAALIGLFSTSRLPIARLGLGLESFRWLFILTFAANLFFTGTGKRIWPFIPVTYDGLNNALVYALRLANLIAISFWLMMTVRPLDLISGLERLFSPLKQWIPVGEFVLAMGIAIRFFPLLLEEGEEIILAQKARGAQFNRLRGLTTAASISVPLFIGAVRRAGELADAMVARGYNPGANRTDWRGNPWHWKDTIVLVSVFIGCVVLIFTL